jgi:hypothetical protein
MTEINYNLGIRSVLSRIKSELLSFGGRKGASKLRTWNVYSYLSLSKKKHGVHAYMYLKNRITNSGYRYDVGANGGWGAVFGNYTLPINGAIRRSNVVNGRGLKGKRVRVARFTGFQMLLWQAVVLYGGSGGCDIRYSLHAGGTNCFRWTLWATTKAVLISRLPI